MITTSEHAIETTQPAKRERAIEGVYRPPAPHWVGDGFRVHGYFSAIPGAHRKLSPFLMLDYHPSYVYAPSTRPRGVGPHPHRGFETVTVAFQGSVAHHDSAGNGGVIGPGDTQWMTAGAGILHKEYHEANWARAGGPFQMAQLWVNLPKAHKMTPPAYQAIVAEDVALVKLPDGDGEVRVIAGEHQGVRGPAKTFTPVRLYEVRLAAGGVFALDVPARENLAVLVMKGDLWVNGTTQSTQHDFILFANDGEAVRISAENEAQLLVLGGEPIDEPVVSYGPFVMNSEQEIRQAIIDYNRGLFGHLED